ncbi:flagellar basal body protein [Desulfolithobacter sp.]
MISGVQSAFSGLQASGVRITAVASNVANMNTEGYRRARVLFEEQKTGGVLAVPERVDGSEVSIQMEAPFGLEMVEHSSTDPSRELSDMRQARAMYQAQMKTISAEQAKMDSVLDITA